MARQELLGENLAAFELRGPAARSHQAKAAARKFIGDAQDQGLLRTYHGEIGAEFSRKIGKLRDAQDAACAS